MKILIVFEIQYGSSLNYLIVPLAFQEGFIFQHCKQWEERGFFKNNNRNTLISTRNSGTNSIFLIQFEVMRSSSKEIYYYDLLLG